jgi:hypothetical protein
LLGRVHELLAHHPAAQKAAWSRATVSFAIFQAAAGYGLSCLFARNGDYRVLFLIGATLLLLAFAIDVAAAGRRTTTMQLRTEKETNRAAT